MGIENRGVNRVRDLVFDDIDEGQLGTSGQAFNAADTGLIAPDSTTLLALSTKTKSNKSIKYNYTLPSTGGSTTTYKEFELRSSLAGFSYDRIVFTGISFTSGGTKDLNITKIHRFIGR